ncbi:MAG: sulfotransferase [Microgenomates group bacterium]
MEQQRKDFVILTTQRTGSTYIAHLLDSHPSIVSYGEIFHPFGIGWGSRTKHKDSKWLLYTRNVLPVEFLKTQIFHTYPSQIASVGFKFMYSQAAQFPSVLKYISQQRQYVIFLNRRNLLASLVSLKRAHYSRVWTSESATEKPMIKIYLDYNECLKYFIETERLHQHFCTVFKNNPSIQIYYEDICQNKHKIQDEILNFLTIPKKPLSSPIKKLQEITLQESIINYSILKNRFSKTKWASFFL